MYAWLRYPFVRFTLALISGIYLSRISHLNNDVLLSGVLLLSIGLFFLRNSLFKHHTWVGSFTLSVILLIGGLRTNYFQQIEWESHFHHFNTQGIVGVVSEPPKIKNHSTNAVVKVKMGKVNGEWIPSIGKIKVFLREPLNYGDVIYFEKKPEKTQGPLNPFEFDYKNYLANQNIFHQVFLNREEYSMIGNDPPSYLIGKSLEIRRLASNQLSEFIADSSVLMVAKALLIGERSSITDELRDAYAHTGAIHILAISGLHLGIIYGFLLFVFTRFRKTWWFVLLSLLSLWFFAFIAGLPPSVVRAAFMFSVLAIGQLMHRKSNVHNTLFLSAFVLLLINPNVLYDVGFQLSYLAVLGIIITYQPLKQFLHFKSIILNKAWALTCVSISAQLLTAPLIVYYFHNVSLIFFVTNLVVVPLTTAILFSGILFFGMGIFHFEFLASLFSQIIERLIHVMNIVIQKIEIIPGTFVDGLAIHWFELLFIYISIGALLLFYFQSKIRWLIGASVFWMFFIFSNIVKTYINESNSKMIVYRTPGNLVIDYYNGKGIKTFYYSESPFQTINNRIHMNGSTEVEEFTIADLAIPGKVLTAGNTTLMIINEPISIKDVLQPIVIDVLVISNNAISDFKTLNFFETPLVLLDASNDFWYAQRVQDYLADSGIQTENIWNGAFILKTN